MEDWHVVQGTRGAADRVVTGRFRMLASGTSASQAPGARMTLATLQRFPRLQPTNPRDHNRGY